MFTTLYLPGDPDTLRGNWLQDHFHGWTIRLCTKKEAQRGVEVEEFHKKNTKVSVKLQYVF